MREDSCEGGGREEIMIVMREEGCGMREMKEEGGVSEERGWVREVRKVAP